MLIGMQEVSFLGNSQVDHLIEDKDHSSIYYQYNVESQLKFHSRPGADPESKLDGNSILVKKTFHANHLKIIDEKKVHLSGFRVAQALKLGLISDESKYFWVVNSHLHHVVGDWQIRLHELQQLHLWLHTQTNLEKDNIFICGDFNLTPQEQTYTYIQKQMGFNSTHLFLKKEEPLITFPTGIQAPHMDTDSPGCFDYIWFKGKQIQPHNINIFGNKPLTTDPTIYPSDHMGLTSDVSIIFE